MGPTDSNSPEIDKNNPWYNKKIGNQLGPLAIELLRDYSKIPESKIEEHIYTIRDRAWQQSPYPCIGQFRFLDISIAKHPTYESVLSQLLHTPAIFLDLGCCFAQDLRKLKFDGVPPSQLFASDLRSSFFDIGKELFRDGDRLDFEFIEGDFFAPVETAPLFARLGGKVDLIYAASFLHLFDWDKQVEAGVRMVKLLKGKGSVVFGRQHGNITPHTRTSMTSEIIHQTYAHDGVSFERLWKEVGEKTRANFKVEVDLPAPMDVSGGEEWQEEGARRMVFTVTWE